MTGAGRTVRLVARLNAIVAALTIACVASAQEPRQRPARERETQMSIFAGRHIDNTWQEVFDTTEEFEYANAGLIGLAWGRNWRRPGAPFSFGFEVQADYQFGDQYHVEFNLPVIARYHLPEPVPVLRSLAFGVGPSYATKVPEYEVESRGDSQQFLMYWTMEAEFGPKEGRTSIYTRLHHRSGMFGAVADEGASNALVLGVRRRW
jgi:hypothetical protein